ncbi:response regulator transcription factor [Variovorax sp. J22R133]|uniref:response regulator transcription factor n=1 Tax=Variovorax brevis TaxID=3053503 RepID=UPI002575F717|nr:response regulator transcription factor [Variovorax sp. J22R133]MDM0112083.1 response regulator transcription factor [Variovorax sp. J22R133]
MIRLLLVDDHPVVRAGYRHLLEQDGDMTVVAQAGDADEAYAMYVANAPDITITDIAMPGSSGLELIRRLRERAAQVRTLVFSMHDSEMLVRRALEFGALGFVSKSSPPECLIDAVHCVRKGGRYLSPGLPQRLLEGEPPAPGVELLTQREFEIFRLLSRGDSIADCARTLHLSQKTVSNLQSLIKDKLGISTTAAMAHLAIRHGLIPPDNH